MIGRVESQRRYEAKRRGTRLEYYRLVNEKKRFSGIRERVILRDSGKCVYCGMTRGEHFSRWGRDITVDHIDGNGRNSSLKNHRMKNLQTLCLSCHGKKDGTNKRFSVSSSGIRSGL